jgi:hypothetical protein
MCVCGGGRVRVRVTQKKGGVVSGLDVCTTS